MHYVYVLHDMKHTPSCTCTMPPRYNMYNACLLIALVIVMDPKVKKTLYIIESFFFTLKAVFPDSEPMFGQKKAVSLIDSVD